jgi:molybdenum cofactor cytidylyltransferase
MYRSFAIIPAAGKSLRMGRPKLSLRLGDRTILERTIDCFNQAGVENVLVVFGPQSPELAGAAGAQVMVLDHATEDMRATVTLGLRRMGQTFHPSAGDRVFLLPADHPALVPEVITRLLAARLATKAHSIIVPTFHGMRGHPVLFDWKHVAKIQDWPPSLALNSYFRSQQDATLELPMDTPAVLRDLDTPEDYERLRREYNVVNEELKS